MMKKIPWRFYITVFLLGGLPFGLAVAVATKKILPSVLLQLAFALSLAFLVVALIAVLYRRAMLKRDPNFTMAEIGVSCNATFTLPVSAGEAFDLCASSLDYIPGFYLQKSSRDQLKMEGSTGGGSAGYWSSGSPGERIAVKITARGPNQSEAFVESRPGTFMIALDFGKNRQNVNAISKSIHVQITRRFEEQRDATERAEMQRALTEAKLSALEAHIEPHFLYNTLANAQLLTRQDPKRADEMLGNLITYLRSSLPQSGTPVNGASSTLGREIERSTAYLEILKIRMGSRLKVSVKMPESLAGCGFPAMMVQTLVENAIKHGLESKPGGGTVSIEAAKVNEQLVLTVSDDGLGLQENTSGTGLGLKNIRDRLKLSFNDDGTLSLKPNAPSGMIATISIPFNGASKNEK